MHDINQTTFNICFWKIVWYDVRLSFCQKSSEMSSFASSCFMLIVSIDAINKDCLMLYLYTKSIFSCDCDVIAAL